MENNIYDFEAYRQKKINSARRGTFKKSSEVALDTIKDKKDFRDGITIAQLTSKLMSNILKGMEPPEGNMLEDFLSNREIECPSYNLRKSELFKLGDNLSKVLNFDYQDVQIRKYGLVGYLRKFGVTFYFMYRDDWFKQNVSIRFNSVGNWSFYLPNDQSDETAVQILVYLGFLLLYGLQYYHSGNTFPVRSTTPELDDVWQDCLYCSLGFFLNVSEFIKDFNAGVKKEPLMFKYALTSSLYNVLVTFMKMEGLLCQSQ